MYEKIIGREGHTVCETCHAPFPKAWIQQGKAVKEGRLAFCSERCKLNYKPDADSGQLSLGFELRHIAYSQA